VERGVGGLLKDSLIDAGHIVTVRKDVLESPLGTMPTIVMTKVDLALRKSLAL
jgi:mRNA-degrading endonuclease toxin of MazEF toxin-antitoxin module